MKFKTHEINGYKIAIIENFFDDLEFEDIVKELNFLNHPTKLFPPTEEDIVDDSLIKNCFENVIDSFYRADNRHVSNILKHTHKLWDDKITTPLQNISEYYRFVKDCNNDSTVVSYFEDRSYYKPHFDKSVVTTITPYFETPKKFEGGNIIINNSLKLELINNHTIVIPSIFKWEITEVSIPAEHIETGAGLYLIRQHLGMIV